MRETKIDVTQEMLDSQTKITTVVRGLQNDEPSMAWRSELNLKLLAMQDINEKKAKVRRWATWGSSFGLTAAMASFAFVVMTNSVQRSPIRDSGANSASMARDFFDVHQESAVLASISGVGADVRESDIVFDPLDFGDVL